MKTALVVVAVLALCCPGAEALLSGSDDFNDNIRDTDKWLIWEFGNGLLHETNGRLEFTSTGTGYEQDAWLWDYNTGSYNENWSVTLDVRNDFGVDGVHGEQQGGDEGESPVPERVFE